MLLLSHKKARHILEVKCDGLFSFVFIRFLHIHTAFLQSKKAIRLRRMAFVLFGFPYIII